MRYLLAFLLLATTVSAANNRPNVLVIVVDDLGWASVGYHTKSVITPNLDRLAREGTELQRFYVYPVCSPTRAALLTGQMPRRFNVMSALQGPALGMPAGLPTISSVFKTAGYQTALIGKWHLGRATAPQQNGFDHFYGFLGSEIDYYRHTGKAGRLDWQRDGRPVEEEGYSTYLLSDEAVKQIKARDRTRPFYFQVTLNAPHVPLSAPKELVEKHQAKGDLPGLYAAVVEAMDIGIGRILDALDTEKIRQDTLVVFFSDNGADRREGGDNTPFNSGKFTVFEGGIHTPALVRWTGRVPAGTTLTQPICVQDLFPTITAAAGVPMPSEAKIDGVNQWAAILQGKRLTRPPFLIASFDNALIDGDWKLIETQDGKRSLFNLHDDISERTDLFAKRADIAGPMGASLDALKKDLPAVTAERGGPFAGPGGNRPGPGGGRGNGPGNVPPARSSTLEPNP